MYIDTRRRAVVFNYETMVLLKRNTVKFFFYLSVFLRVAYVRAKYSGQNHWYKHVYMGETRDRRCGAHARLSESIMHHRGGQHQHRFASFIPMQPARWNRPKRNLSLRSRLSRNASFFLARFYAPVNEFFFFLHVFSILLVFQFSFAKRQNCYGCRSCPTRKKYVRNEIMSRDEYVCKIKIAGDFIDSSVQVLRVSR